MTERNTVTQVRRIIFLGNQPRSRPNGAGSQRPQIFLGGTSTYTQTEFGM